MFVPDHTPAWGWSDKLSGIFVMSPDEDRMARYNSTKPFPVIGEVTETEKIALKETVERVAMVMGWVLRGLSRRSQQGGINASPPVFSRVYQVLSDGMIGYQNAMKVNSIVPLKPSSDCTTTDCGLAIAGS